MSDLSTGVRRPRRLTDYEAKVLRFMTENGHTSYERDIETLREQFDEWVAEAGPGGNHCPFTQARLDAIEKEIDGFIAAAIDRYDDWVSDPLP